MPRLFDKIAALVGRRRHKVPLILQMEVVECGAACLGMVLASFGRWVPLEELRTRCNVSRNGVSAADLVEAAASYGLGARAYSCDIDELRDKPLPQILFWGFDHFVVLEGWSRNVSGGVFHIADPAVGRRRLTEAEFSRHFTGIVLAFEREASFMRSSRPPGIGRYFLDQARRSKGAVAFIVSASVLLGLLAILVPSFTQIFIDEYLGQERRDWLLPLLGAMIAVSLLRTALAWFQVDAVQLLTAKVTLDLSAGFIWRLFHLPLSFFVRRSAGEVSTRAQMAGIAGAVAGPLIQIGIGLINLAMFAAAMALYSLPLAALCVVLAVCGLLALRGLEQAMRESSVRLEMLGGSAHAIGIQGMALLEDYRATGTDSLLFERLMDAELKHVDAEQRMGRLKAFAASFPHLFQGLMAILVLGVGSLQVFDGAMTIGALIAFYMLSELFAGTVGSLFGFAVALQGASGAVVRVRDTTDHAPDPVFDKRVPAGVAAEAGGLRGAVEAHALRYAYANGTPVLDGIDLALAPGEMVALIGPSGSGKTTLGQVLAGMMKPDDGTLHFDGRALEDIPEPTFRGSIGYVEQLPYLFSGRIRDNLTLWDHTAETAVVAQAAQDAAVEATIARRPGNYEGRVGEHGSGFSGGERQMLAIARALVREPSLLVLDEATSALDTRSEEHVLTSLRRRAITCLLITHRLSAIRFCTRVLVIERGRIVADGAPEAVLAAEGRFGPLVETPS
jgi:NHLM bacteriocin system ABC transporter peptidase/ATP-binding protein